MFYSSASSTFVCLADAGFVTLCKISKMNRWIYTIAMLIIGTPLFSQVHFVSLADVLQYADKNSTVAKQGTIQRAISDQDAGIARAGLLPKLNAFGLAEYAPMIASQVIPGKYIRWTGRQIPQGAVWHAMELFYRCRTIRSLDQFRKMGSAREDKIASC